MRLRDYYKQDPFALLTFLPYIVALVMIWCAPCHAQEPRSVIRPADPISVSVHTHEAPVASTNVDPGAPMIYPAPLPNIGLAQIAKSFRMQHAFAVKAVKVANDETPIVDVDTIAKTEEKQ